MPETNEWLDVCAIADVPADAGICVLVDGAQIALFRVAGEPTIYAVQNRCPHWNEMVLWRGLTGDHEGEPRVACPMHKKQFSLATGRCLTEDTDAVRTFGGRTDGDRVLLARPSEEFLAAEREHVCSPRSAA